MQLLPMLAVCYLVEMYNRTLCVNMAASVQSQTRGSWTLVLCLTSAVGIKNGNFLPPNVTQGEI